MAVALIVAAGSGERLGAGGPKALVPVGGRPMLEWSLRTLAQVPAVSDVVVALPPGHLDAVTLPPGVVAVAGGGVRSESVLAALVAAPAGDPILVHDAARPLASPELFTRAIACLEESGADAVIAAVPSTNTLKRVRDGAVVETLDRAEIWAVQTPQVFRRTALEAALASASALGLAAATDDASLIEAAGGEVRVLAAEEWNIKITWPQDLQIAELLLSQR